MRSLLTAAVILWSVVSHIAVADERPSGIPDEAKYVKVDRITDGDTIVLVDSIRVRLHGIDTPERPAIWLCGDRRLREHGRKKRLHRHGSLNYLPPVVFAQQPA